MKNLENTCKFNLHPSTVPIFQQHKPAIQLLSCTPVNFMKIRRMLKLR